MKPTFSLSKLFLRFLVYRFAATLAMTTMLLSYSLSQEHQNLVIQTLNGNEVSLKELTSKGPVLVNFWALWCEPCKLEMKQLQSIYNQYKDKGFSIVAINQDNQKSVSKVSSYISSQEYSFYISTDSDGEIAQQFNVQNIPFSLLFDTNGMIVYKALGYKPGDEKKIEEELEILFSTKE
ncbi:MAG: TlpA disulfide reductase family protein [Bacteroidota bacterium]|nr:TlpA disulfide reductase family protein [Bacteroidota bacterium]